MNTAILNMLKRYACVTSRDYKSALQEIIQEIALLGLWRAKFFERSAFYGGTALRILYHTERFSEDLDFSLLKPEPQFNLTHYQTAIEEELKSFGFNVSFSLKEKSKETAIQSAFLKANTLEHFIQVDVPLRERKRCHLDESIKIKLEIDTNPPPDFSTEVRYLLQPVPFFVRVYSQPDLFAGKLHALLCREWKNRVKGRDWYDLVWFVAQKIPVNLRHLEVRLRQTAHWKGEKTLDEQTCKSLLLDKIAKLDLELMKKDILPFIKKPELIVVWSQGFFRSLVGQITFEA